MIFYGKEHPLFSSYITSPLIEKTVFSKDMNAHKGVRISKNDLEEGKKYFIHPGLPMVDRDADIEYVFNFEDQMTLYRFTENGYTFNVDFKTHPENDYIRYILEDSRCKKIICHIKKMAEALPKLLNSDIIANKTIHENVGIDLKVNTFTPKKKGDLITILFTNSYYDWDMSFYLRGGHILIRAFNFLCKDYKNVRLIIRSNIPKDYYDKNLLNNDKIEIINDFLSEEELAELYKKADLVVLPAARVHSHSICQAFSYGLPVISTNGWGIEEFITHKENGVIIEGFNDISWHNEEVGCVEDYNNVFFIGKTKIDQLYFYLSSLLENPDDLNILKNNSLKTCVNKYSLLNWEKWKI